MPKLTVHELAKEDVYKDLVRIPECHRLDESGNRIEESTVCWIRGTPKESVATLRGFQHSKGPEIHMDDRTRNRLGVELGRSYNFTFSKARWWGQLRWAWCASETGYQIASRLAVIGLLLGILAFLPLLVDWLKCLWGLAVKLFSN
jgi:hypothetical protein